MHKLIFRDSLTLDQARDITGADRETLRAARRDLQIVFQDPYTSLNPRMTVGDIIGEPFEIHKDVVPKGGRRKRVQELLDLVGLTEYADRRPGTLSGGQRQRVALARSLAPRPSVPWHIAHEAARSRPAFCCRRRGGSS